MNFKFLFYLALLFLPFDSFPFNLYGLGSNKPLSLYIFILFFLVNIDKVLKIKLYKEDFCFFLCIPIMCLISYFKAKYIFYSDSGVTTFVNNMIGFIAIYLSFTIAIHNTKSKSELDRYIRIIIIGYSISFFIGILEILFMYFNITSISEILKYIIRDTNYLTEKRLHFSFGEPSYIGQHLFLVLMPILYYKNRFSDKKSSNKYRIFLYAFIMLSIFSISSQLIIDFIVFFAVVILINKSFKQKIVYILASIIILLSINNLFINNNYFHIKSPYYSRIVSNIQSIKGDNDNMDVVNNDQSIRVRYDLSAVSYKAIKDNILSGYGFGNFIFAYRNYINDVDPLFYNNEELTKIYYSDYKFQYNFYLFILSDGGIIGVAWILLFFGRIIHNIGILKNRMGKFFIFMVMAFYLLIQSNLFGSNFILFWICISKELFLKKEYTYLSNCEDIKDVS